MQQDEKRMTSTLFNTTFRLPEPKYSKMVPSPTKNSFLKKSKQKNSISDLDIGNYDQAILGISKLGNLSIQPAKRVVNSGLGKQVSPSKVTFQELKPTAANSKMTTATSKMTI